MSRKPIIAGNWKMNLLQGDAKALFEGIKSFVSSYSATELPTVVIAPTFTSLCAVSSVHCDCGCGGDKISIAAQNCHWEKSGAFTGEISADMLAEMADAFPDAVDEKGADRRKLSEIVFRDEEALRTLNAITHRYVLSEVKRLLRACAMEGYALAAVDAVELFAGGVSSLCDVTVAVLAPKEKRIQRIMQRDGLSRERAELRVSAQKGDDYYRQHCTVTVYNDDDVLSEAFQKQILEFTGE